MDDRHPHQAGRFGRGNTGAGAYRRPAPTVSGRPTAQKRGAGTSGEAGFKKSAAGQDAAGQRAARPGASRASAAGGSVSDKPGASAPSGAFGKKAPSKKRLRRMRRALVRGSVLVLAVLAVFGLSWVITRMIRGEDAPALTDENNASSAAALPDDGETLPALPAMDNTSWNFVGPVERSGTAPVTEPDRRMIALPENGRIDLQYFDNTVFVGDSITVGLQYWNAIPNAKYCAYVGVGPRQIYDGSLQRRPDETQEVPMEAIVASQPDNVYVLLGTNAMVTIADDEVLLTYYGEMLDAMRASLEPSVSFYVQSITPVLPGFEDTFDNARIDRLNDALAKLAFEKDMYFLDLHEALAGDDGYMRSDYGVYEDGYHMQPSGYQAWAEYLVTHTAYNRRHAHMYLEGSHYYQQNPPAEAA